MDTFSFWFSLFAVLCASWICGYVVFFYSLVEDIVSAIGLEFFFIYVYISQLCMLSWWAIYLLCLFATFFWKVCCNPHLHGLDPFLYLCPDTLSSGWFTPLGRLSFELFIWVIGFLTFDLISGWVLFNVSTCLLNSSLKS